MKRITRTRRNTVVPDGAHALVSVLASSPILFPLLFLFLIVLAIPIKIFSPRTRIFR